MFIVENFKMILQLGVICTVGIGPSNALVCAIHGGNAKCEGRNKACGFGWANGLDRPYVYGCSDGCRDGRDWCVDDPYFTFEFCCCVSDNCNELNRNLAPNQLKWELNCRTQAARDQPDKYCWIPKEEPWWVDYLLPEPPPPPPTTTMAATTEEPTTTSTTTVQPTRSRRTTTMTTTERPNIGPGAETEESLLNGTGHPAPTPEEAGEDDAESSFVMVAVVVVVVLVILVCCVGGGFALYYCHRGCKNQPQQGNQVSPSPARGQEEIPSSSLSSLSSSTTTLPAKSTVAPSEAA